MGTTVTLDEMEQQAGKKEETPPPKPNASEVKLDFEGIPDALKGKGLTEIMETLERTQKALRMSEDARLALRRSIETGESAPVRTVEEVPESQKPLTREQLKELITEDPLAAYDYMQNNMIAALDDHLNTRFEPLVRGNAGTMEAQAREKYKAEFELFGDQIEAAKKQVDPRILMTANGWDDIVSYIRGRPQNFETLLTHRSKPTAEAARTKQQEDVGFTASRGSNNPPATGGNKVELDETQKEIARELFPNAKTPEEAYDLYKKWS